MSITKDIRSYADSALEQGKQVLDQAQTQLNDVTGQANGLVGKLTGTAKDNVSGFTAKATDAVADLRVQAEKAVNIDALKAAIEPYLAQAKVYSTTVTDRAEGLYTSVKNDKRVGKLFVTAESLTGVVVETVQVRVVKPVQALTGRSKPAPQRASKPKPAATKPGSAPAAAATVRKATPRKAPAAKVAGKA